MSGPKTTTSSAAKPRKRFVGRSAVTPGKAGSSIPVNQIPPEILQNDGLNASIASLPNNYSFEIHKTIHQIKKNGANMVALQMPEGLQMFACTIADIIEQYTDALTVILGDVTYGACCIDDYTAVALGCDMLVHYGHSCLVPVDTTTIKTLYIFVEISIDSSHLANSIRLNFPDDRNVFQDFLLSDEDARRQIPTGTQIGAGRHLRIEGPENTSYRVDQNDEVGRSRETVQRTRLALVSTIQFAAALQRLKEDLSTKIVDLPPGDTAFAQTSTKGHRMWTGIFEITIPRAKPLSPGELLGCTAPSLTDVDALVYLGDGRFHLESIMIANPTVPAFRYDPYSKKLTRERYDHLEMRSLRTNSVERARSTLRAAEANSDDLQQVSAPQNYTHWGVILGTLGRQGSFKQLQAIVGQMKSSAKSVPYIPILLSELSPAKLALFNPHISAFVQTSCPRLSIDWGYAFDRPLLSPYEAAVAVGRLPMWEADESKGQSDGGYLMDFYDMGSLWAISRKSSSFEVDQSMSVFRSKLNVAVVDEIQK